MQAWEEFLTHLDQELGVEVVKRWLRPLKILSFDAGNLYIEAKDYFQALWFEEHIRSRAKRKLLNNSQKPFRIHLSVANEFKSPNTKATNQAKRKIKLDAARPHFSMNFDALDPLLTLEHFLPAASNYVPLKLLCEVLGYDPEKKVPAKVHQKLGTFNPIYIYGREGTGKTHLLMAAAKAFREKGLDVIYARSSTFTEHVVNAIRAGEMSQFRERYRKTDLLILDDVHLFSRKGATQEELFHTFNTLHLASKQIILSSKCAPQELQMIEPRLVSRFEWGISLPLDPMDKEGLEKILDIKSHLLNFPLSQKVKEYLLETFYTSPKAIVKALEALVLRFHMKDQSPHFSSTTLTVPTVRHILTDIQKEEEKLAITPEKILKATAESFGIPVEDLLSKSQARDCVFPRQLVMYLCRKNLDMPFMKIGDLFNRDHSTVMSSVRKVEEKYQIGDKDILQAIKDVEKLTSN